MDEDSVLLGYDAVSMGDQFPMFQRNIVPPGLRI
jgi:hypothetical protein